MITHDVCEPTSDERRHAVCLAMAWAPSLVRFAARYTHSLEDAEDAYQRAMEIALTSAPVTDPDKLLTWLHTVIRREAAELARIRRREQPVPAEDLDVAVTARSAQPTSPDAIVEWRERYRGLQDAWTALSDEQRVCLLLRSRGVTRPEIQELTGFSLRKVHRAIAEGRASLTAWEVRMASGQECASVRELIDTVLDGESSGRDRRVLSRHINHCPACRAAYRDQRDQLRLLGSLVPTVLIGAELVQSAPADPSLALTWWERLSASATVKSTQAVQVMMDLPAFASTKAGAGALAAAAAGVVGTPLAIDAVQARRATPGAPARVITVAPAPNPAATSPATPPIIPTLPERTRAAITSTATSAKISKLRVPRVRVTVRPSPRRVDTRRSPGQPRPTVRHGSPIQEFGP